jgi:anti-sigma factor RsiW
MNDFRENELLSAYLDGELTAAERKEAERLLADSPPARKLLAELRALRATLQALPRQELGEDLSGQVVREARRRILSEGKAAQPAESSAEPVFMARSVLGRFINRRTVAWLAVTAVIAILITINERRNRVAPVANGGREVARAPAALKEGKVGDVREAVSPPSIQAAPADLKRVGGEGTAAIEAKAGPAKKAGPASLPIAKAESPRERAAGALSVRNYEAEKGHLVPGSPSPAKARPDAAKTGSRSMAKRLAAEDLLVVYCDVSPEAARGKALDKLLEANGVWHERRAPVRRKGGGEKKAAPRPQELVVDAEATPAQLKAVLAGLEAQPAVFYAVSVNPGQENAARDESAFQRQTAAGKSNRSLADGEAQDKGKAPSQEKSDQAAVAPKAAAPGGPPPAGQSGPAAPRDGFAAQQRARMPLEGERQSLAQSAIRQRIVFILRVVDDDQPAAAAKRPAKEEADADKKP